MGNRAQAPGARAGGQPLAVVVLAAGQGMRMRSTLPKVLHEVAGLPLLDHVLRAVQPLAPERTVVVVGHGAERVRERFGDRGLDFVEQERQLGTGHALLQTRDALAGHEGPVLVVNGDGPLLAIETLRRLLEAPGEDHGMALVTCELDDPSGYGRILRGSGGAIEGIVEEKDATPVQKAIHEINPGTYLFLDDVFARAERLGNDNASGEYYLTDLVDVYLADGRGVAGASCADPREALGVNTRAQLAEAEAALRERIRARWLAAGVTMRDPATTYVDPDVDLAPDVVLEPGVFLSGDTRVGAGATVGAYACLADCVVAPAARVPPHAVARGERFGA